MNRTPLTRIAAMALAATALSACGVFKGDGPKTTPTVGERVPILTRVDTSTTVDPSLAGTAVVVPTAVANTDWAQAGGTARNAYGHVAFSTQPQLAWRARIAGSDNKRRLGAAPVIGDGKLFAVGTDGRVQAFDASTGTPRWTYTLEVARDAAQSAFGGGATYAAGRVYATGGAGDVVALDADTGSELWKVTPAGPLRGSPTVAFNSVFLITQDNRLFALSAADGSLLWEESGSQGQTNVFGVAAPAAGQGTIIAGYSSGELSAYRYENGRVLWQDALARTSMSTEVGTLTDIDADPIIEDGRVYALGQGGRMAAYELVTGRRLWELNLAGISTPAVAGEWIFALTDDARLIAIQRNSGKVRWLEQLSRWRKEKSKSGEIFWSGPVLAGNRLWMTNSEGYVYSADPMTGQAAQFTRMGDRISLPPVVANQTMYFLNDNGEIFAYR